MNKPAGVPWNKVKVQLLKDPEVAAAYEQIQNVVTEDPTAISDLAILLGFCVEASARDAADYKTIFNEHLRSEFGDALAEWAKDNMLDIVAELRGQHAQVAGLIEKLDAIVAELKAIDDASK